MAGDTVTLPDLMSILPYLGLVAVVILRPDDTVGCAISTQHLPPLSILQNNHFVPAPEGASPAAQNVARIFDVIAVATALPQKSPGIIPLSSEDPEFQQQRYWRLSVKTEAVLATLFRRIGNVMHYSSAEIDCAQKIFSVLCLQSHGLEVVVYPEIGGSSRGGRDGIGLRGGNSDDPKRSLRDSDRTEPPPKRGRTKRTMRGHVETSLLSEPGVCDRSGE
jgi:hypothetical protein